MPRIVDDDFAIGDQVLIRHGRGAGLVGNVHEIVSGFTGVASAHQELFFVKVPGLSDTLQTRRRDLAHARDDRVEVDPQTHTEHGAGPRRVEYGRLLVHRRWRVRPTPVAPSLAPQPGPSKRKREAAAVAEFSNAVDALQEKGKLDEQEWKQLLELGMKLHNA